MFSQTVVECMYHMVLAKEGKKWSNKLHDRLGEEKTIKGLETCTVVGHWVGDHRWKEELMWKNYQISGSDVCFDCWWGWHVREWWLGWPYSRLLDCADRGHRWYWGVWRGLRTGCSLFWKVSRNIGEDVLLSLNRTFLWHFGKKLSLLYRFLSQWSHRPKVTMWWNREGWNHWGRGWG